MEVGIKEFRSNISKYLENLPIVLTKFGKPYAVIQRVSDLKNEEEVTSLPEPEIFYEDGKKFKIENGKKYVFSTIAGKWIERGEDDD